MLWNSTCARHQGEITYTIFSSRWMHNWCVLELELRKRYSVHVCSSWCHLLLTKFMSSSQHFMSSSLHSSCPDTMYSHTKVYYTATSHCNHEVTFINQWQIITFPFVSCKIIEPCLGASRSGMHVKARWERGWFSRHRAIMPGLLRNYIYIYSLNCT